MITSLPRSQYKDPQLTFSRNVGRNDPPAAQPDLGRLAVPRIRLLRFRDADLQAHALHLGPADHGRGDGAAHLLGLAAAVSDLVVACEGGRGGGECSVQG